jgi:hypothetical protein
VPRSGIRLVQYPTTDGREAWAKEVGNYVLPANSDEVALWKERERLRAAIEAALAVFDDQGLSEALAAIHILRDALAEDEAE